MSRLIAMLRRLVGGDPAAQTAGRLVRERPRATRQFTDRLRVTLAPQWTSATRPTGLWLRALAFASAGLVLLGIATIIAGS